MAMIIRADGSKEKLEDTSLESLQKVVGGYIQIISCVGNRFMVMNEEGRLLELPLNKEATEFAKGFIFEGDYIAGDVVVADRDEID